MPTIKELLSEQQIQSKVIKLAEQIARDNADADELNFVVVLNGAANFYGDLKRALRNIRPSYMFNDTEIKLQSYAGTDTTGTVRVVQDLEDRIVAGKPVIVVEDIVDRGVTMRFLLDYLRTTKRAESVKLVSLLDKPSRRLPGHEINIDYRGFEIEDLFVVGYGLDYNGKYRDLPFIGVLDEG